MRAPATYKNTARRTPNIAIVNPLALHPRVDPLVKSGGALITVPVEPSCRVGPKLVETPDCAVAMRLELATLERLIESVTLMVLVPEVIVTVMLEETVLLEITITPGVVEGVNVVVILEAFKG